MSTVIVPGLTTLRSLIDIEAGIFSPLESGHVLTWNKFAPSEFTIGAKIQAATMMQVFELQRGDQKVGFFVYSAFKVVNRGGVVITYLESKKGKGKTSSVVFRHPLLVVYDIPGCGSIAVSPMVNERISSILNEQ